MHAPTVTTTAPTAQLAWTTSSPGAAPIAGGGPASRYRRVERRAPRPCRRDRTSSTYLVRRAVVGALAVVVTAALAVVAMSAVSVVASSGGRAASAAGARADGAPTETHVARAGDSLWSIAEAHRGDIEHGRYLDALIGLNSSTVVHVGQSVLLP
ncbi:hypothetical protein [Ilumatobacter sp.]|uniref:hypothetical protein n=1 Tax=Ilumatobacter sp. TaxID=1967498 RepID=UPI003B526BA1